MFFFMREEFKLTSGARTGRSASLKKTCLGGGEGSPAARLPLSGQNGFPLFWDIHTGLQARGFSV